MEEFRVLKLTELHEFKNHPFRVDKNFELFELARSIEKEGVLVPLLARPNSNGLGYELISGHRRKVACEWARIREVPVIIKNLDDNQAIITMVDSNIQRENIKPSEKAFAYRMKLDAMKKQGSRTDLTSGQDVQKLNKELLATYMEKSDIKFATVEKKITSRKVLARQMGESDRQIQRYIRLNNLVPKILSMVDENKIAFTVAVELSYLKEEEQYDLYAIMDLEQSTPSLSQANRIKRLSQSNELNMDKIYTILKEQKPNQREYIKFRADSLVNFFPQSYTTRQKIELIQKLVKEWYEKHNV